MFVKKFENWKPLGYYYKCRTQDLFYIFICKLLKVWKIKFETTKFLFFWNK
jgi:hypothetical protein